MRDSKFADGMSRREALTHLAAVVAAGGMVGGTGGCGLAATSVPSGDGRLRARPATPTGSVSAGTSSLTVSGAPDASLFIPASYRSSTPAPLAGLLHGAGLSKQSMFQAHVSKAEELGLVLVFPRSIGGTWDVINGGFAHDVTAIDAVLGQVFARVAVDRSRLSIVGFSDGGTYSLALGRINGDLFTKIVAYSPGFLTAGAPTGKPKILITHGTQDVVLPIDQTSRQIVPALRNAGYEVDYREFAGPHAISLELLGVAMAWVSS